MSVKDMLLALCVVVAWGVNFVVIKLGLQGMPPFLLAGLRFALVAFPGVDFHAFSVSGRSARVMFGFRASDSIMPSLMRTIR